MGPKKKSQQTRAPGETPTSRIRITASRTDITTAREAALQGGYLHKQADECYSYSRSIRATAKYLHKFSDELEDKGNMIEKKACQLLALDNDFKQLIQRSDIDVLNAMQRLDRAVVAKMELFQTLFEDREMEDSAEGPQTKAKAQRKRRRGKKKNKAKKGENAKDITMRTQPAANQAGTVEHEVDAVQSDAASNTTYSSDDEQETVSNALAEINFVDDLDDLVGEDFMPGRKNAWRRERGDRKGWTSKQRRPSFE